MTRTLAGLDLAALQHFLISQVSATAGRVSATLIEGGRSNLTYLIADGVNRWVLRRPPLGHLTPTAHDMVREYRVIAALHGTNVPVPEPVLLCEDTAVLGCVFAVFGFVEGLIIRDGHDAATIAPALAARYSQSLVDALVTLHSIDPRGVGIGVLGSPGGYLERQVRRWHDQWHRVATREVATVEVLHDRLRHRLPSRQRTAVVHGDYRLDNCILSPDGGIAAVIDWEMATLGDPLADLGLLQVYWDPISQDVLGTGHAPTMNRGFLTRDELAQRYSRAIGDDLEELAFYRALGYFKLAVIAEGIHRRYREHDTIGDGFAKAGAAVAVLLAASLDELA